MLNLFNEQTALSRDNRAFLDPRTRLFDGTQVAGRPGQLHARADHQHQSANAALGQPTSYAPPRRLLLMARVDF